MPTLRFKLELMGLLCISDWLAFDPNLDEPIAARQCGLIICSARGLLIL
jgi:hypothetical protein